MKKNLIILVQTILLILAIALKFNGNNRLQASKNLLFGKELIRLTSQKDILTNLENGSCDIGVMDSIMGGWYAGKSDKYVVLDYNFGEEKYGVGANKGDKALISEVNKALKKLKEDGTINEIATKFGQENKILINENDNCADATDDSFRKIIARKKLVIGYTVFEPIAFKKNGTLTGVDIELAKVVVTHWNNQYGTQIVLEPILIEWSKKETMLQNGTIDLIWNGMTLNKRVLDNLEISIPYMTNQQIALVKNVDLAKYDTLVKFLENSQKAIVAIERGSAADYLMNL
ncbi:MAG: transporter substrate-binding domain-containing protein [Clostridiales Family XIII bacterium]|jgi:polar amino acid transport system substrate-binding protein|nr:transporter substrate-binding domain-containing protein [Clostridiales Family XIII bacterium]